MEPGLLLDSVQETCSALLLWSSIGKRWKFSGVTLAAEAGRLVSVQHNSSLQGQMLYHSRAGFLMWLVFTKVFIGCDPTSLYWKDCKTGRIMLLPVLRQLLVRF